MFRPHARQVLLVGYITVKAKRILAEATAEAPAPAGSPSGTELAAAPAASA
jgi:hypothetical protein